MALSVFGIDFGTNNIKIYNGISKTILNEKNIIGLEKYENNQTLIGDRK